MQSPRSLSDRKANECSDVQVEHFLFHRGGSVAYIISEKKIYTFHLPMTLADSVFILEGL